MGKISELTELTTPASGDFFTAVDTSANETKKVPYDNMPGVGAILADGTVSGTAMQELLGLNFTDATELTIASGSITRTQTSHRVDTESDAASDDLATISGGSAGDIVILRAENAARVVTLKHGTGNIQVSTAADFALPATGFAILVYDGTNWRVNSSGGGGISDIVEDTTPQLGGNLDAQSNKITSLSAPTAGGDAANKTYVDGLIPLAVPSRLEYSSATEVVLTQVAGGEVWNPLTSEQADVSSEPTDDTTGLSADTLYQVYLDTGTAALSIESTASAQTNGIYHKLGDTGRLLVGWVYTNGSTQFADSDTERHVSSLHHARPRQILETGAFQSNLTADASWKTPSTDMLVSYIRHPFYSVDLHCAISMRHDAAGGYCRAGIDVGLTGTPQTNNYIQLSGAGEVATISLAACDESGSAARRQSRVRVMGENIGAATFDLYSGQNYLKGVTWG